MKKLIIKDHLGEVVLGADVYLEGQDFALIEPVPKPIWVKEIHIIDPDKLPELIKEEIAEVIPEPEPEPEPESELTHKELLVLPVEESKPIEEVNSHEPETANNKSAGDKGAGKAEQSPSPEATSKKPARRKTTKRSS